MSQQDQILILFCCDLAFSTDQKTRNTLRRKTAGSCVHKGINGFFLSHRGGFVGVFEGPKRKVLAQIEGLIRKPFIEGVQVVRENPVEQPCWHGWFADGRELKDLPPEQQAQMPGLAQFITDKLNAV